MNFTFAILGCGRIAERHAAEMLKYGKVVAVCDIDNHSADEMAARTGAEAYYTIHELIQNVKVDLVAVCTPNGLHAEHSIMLLEAGMNVLCEKPMAINTFDCQRMIDTAESTGKLLFIVKQNRFNPPVESVKYLIDSGILGQIYSVQLNCFWNRGSGYYQSPWRGTKELDGGTLYTQFSHFIDLLF